LSGKYAKICAAKRLSDGITLLVIAVGGVTIIRFAAIAKIKKMGTKNKCYCGDKKPQFVSDQNFFQYQENKAHGKNQ
jgi:hypothetical protein